MYSEAHDRIHDAEILSNNITKLSDSDALLRILGFEILLKCAIFASGQNPKHSHNYKKLWLALPGKAQKEILESAQNRYGPHTNFEDVEKLLTNYQYVFEKGRYFFELYEGYTLEEQRELGEFWNEIGAPDIEADIQYHPMELIALIHGLSEFIKNKAF